MNLSSLFDFYIPSSYCFAGEVGLTGEIRAVSQVEKRIKEYANKDENVTVILDALCDLNSLRIKYVKENPEYNKYVLVVFPRTFEYVQKFNKMRDQEVWVPDDILRQLYDKYEKPSAEALGYFNEVLIVKEDD